MGEIISTRRGFLKGLVALVAAPAIVRATSLMPVRAAPLVTNLFVYDQEHVEIALGYAITRKAIDDNLYKAQFAPSNLGLSSAFRKYARMSHG